MAADEGPLETVGWGRFPLPGERNWLRRRQAADLAEMEELRSKVSRNGNFVSAGEFRHEAQEAYENTPARRLEQEASGESSVKVESKTATVESVAIPLIGVTIDDEDHWAETTGDELVMQIVPVKAPPDQDGRPGKIYHMKIELPEEEWKNPLVIQRAITDEIKRRAALAHTRYLTYDRWAAQRTAAGVGNPQSSPRPE